MFFQSLSFDLQSVVVSSTGRVLFYNSNDELVVAIKKTDDFQLHYSENFLYIWKEGNKPVFSASGEVTIALGSLYKMTVFSLNDIDGKSFTPITDLVSYDLEEYKAKQQEAFEWLEANVLVGCCDGGSGSSSVAFYDTSEDFPTTGTTDILYVDKETPALYLWDGAAYVAFGGGGAVESVTGDSVDNTDPANPIVNAIPLEGTASGSPVTGSVEIQNGTYQEFYSTDGTIRVSVVFNDGGSSNISIKIEDANGVTQMVFEDSLRVGINATNPNFEGYTYQNDHSSKFTLRSLIDQEVMKKRIWTKAGAPDANDDSADGFIVGSLLWDTTNSIMYKCTSNSAGAATWEAVFTASSYENLTGCSVTNALQITVGNTRYLPMVFSGNFNGVTNSSHVATKYSRGGVLSGFTVDTNSTQPASDLTFTLMKGTAKSSMADTAIVVTVPSGSAAGSFTTASTLVVDDGNYLCWKVVQGGTGTSAVIEQISCVLAH